MNSAQADAYLRRLGADRPARPTAEVLRELHLRHLRAVPFENLSVHLGEEIVLEEKHLLDKVVAIDQSPIAQPSPSPSPTQKMP